MRDICKQSCNTLIVKHRMLPDQVWAKSESKNVWAMNYSIKIFFLWLTVGKSKSNSFHTISSWNLKKIFWKVLDSHNMHSHHQGLLPFWYKRHLSYQKRQNHWRRGCHNMTSGSNSYVFMYREINNKTWQLTNRWNILPFNL